MKNELLNTIGRHEKPRSITVEVLPPTAFCVCRLSPPLNILSTLIILLLAVPDTGKGPGFRVPCSGCHSKEHQIIISKRKKGGVVEMSNFRRVIFIPLFAIILPQIPGDNFRIIFFYY